MVAADGDVVQLSLAHAGGTNRHAAGNGDQSDIIALDFDPRRELMFWVDSQQRKVYRSALPKGSSFEIISIIGQEEV
ncbi:unnamed protein product [Gongylonema pulchrum]|uniref:6-phosphogluconolactonase n=1 Tax=Gongylonema pulchrum TaxID=637853 RepID=A0A183EMG6_9BILA|nr:unnamed protein product [Gongylonema pulchrum]